MKCTYHVAIDSQAFCSTCNKPLCGECTHQVKGKAFCEDCLVRGAEWAATVKDLRIPTDSPKRAALVSLIPGMGAVYNGEYVKAITQFAVFAALCVMGDDFHQVFGFGAFAFLVFTMFDSYRTAEARNLARIEARSPTAVSPSKDRSVAGWGVFLILLGVVFLLQNIIPYHFLHRLWPLVFIGLGGYLVYFAVGRRAASVPPPPPAVGESKQF
jgi:LiaI-LiaF-like transmembrane region